LDLFACKLATLVQCIGSLAVAGIFGILAAHFINRLLPLSPPVATSSIILIIGVSLMRVGINWTIVPAATRYQLPR
jgi:NCS2 family nucleobase:cation symporter-2